MKKNSFSRLRHKAAAGDNWAQDRLRWHVQRWLAKGWGHLTIARRLGLELADVTRLAGIDMTPRLVRRGSER
jgi:hypothetical protein